MEKKASLLFVDDEERIVKLFNIVFRSQYNVFTATSGVDAINIIKNNSIDVIVSDQRMPSMLGIELLSVVRKVSPNTVRILLTGYSDLVAIIGAVNEGEVYRFLNKPWDQDEIKIIINEAVEYSNRMSRGEVCEEDSVKNVEGYVSEELSQTKILLLDTEYTHLEMNALLENNFTLLTAPSIEEAIKKLENDNIGVIITDIKVGREDVIDFLRMLKKINPFITVVMLSGMAESELIIKLINQAHIYRFVMKPISINIFRLAIEAAIKEHYRLLADLSLVKEQISKSNHLVDLGEESGMVNKIIKSLSHLKGKFNSNS